MEIIFEHVKGRKVTGKSHRSRLRTEPQPLVFPTTARSGAAFGESATSDSAQILSLCLSALLVVIFRAGGGKEKQVPGVGLRPCVDGKTGLILVCTDIL